MSDTPPARPIAQRDSQTLLEDLCIALRYVGMSNYQFHPDDARKKITEVQSIHQELSRRHFDPTDRLTELSQQTKWRMLDLLEDCLAYPRAVPYVKDPDGIRIHLRCHLCRTAEHPPNPEFWMCDNCLKRVIDSIESKTPINGIILFRTFNTSARCAHADSDTVLAADSWQETIFGNCAKCFTEELQRRSSGLPRPTLKEFTIDLTNVKSFTDIISAFNDGLIKPAGGNWNGNLDAFNDYLSWPPEQAYRLILLGWNRVYPILSATPFHGSQTMLDVITEIFQHNPHVQIVYS